MSRWAQAKQLIEFDWRAAWQDVARGTMGEQPAQVYQLVEAMDQAYHRKDKAGFLALKAQLVKQPSWIGSSDSSSSNPPAGCGKPTAVPTQLDCLI